jgi:hypothetical protein
MTAHRSGYDHSSDEGAFRLLTAFSGIYEPERRQALVELAEAFERDSLPLPSKLVVQGNVVFLVQPKT